MPVFSPDSIGDLMDRCWEKEPSDRPTFNELKEKLGDMLEENVQQHYLKMNNDPFFNMNYCNENQQTNNDGDGSQRNCQEEQRLRHYSLIY